MANLYTNQYIRTTFQVSSVSIQRIVQKNNFQPRYVAHGNAHKVRVYNEEEFAIIKEACEKMNPNLKNRTKGVKTYYQKNKALTVQKQKKAAEQNNRLVRICVPTGIPNQHYVKGVLPYFEAMRVVQQYRKKGIEAWCDSFNGAYLRRHIKEGVK